MSTENVNPAPAVEHEHGADTPASLGQTETSSHGTATEQLEHGEHVASVDSISLGVRGEVDITSETDPVTHNVQSDPVTHNGQSESEVTPTALDEHDCGISRPRHREPPSEPPAYSTHPDLQPVVPPVTPSRPAFLSPPSYAEAVRTGRLTFVDFAPKCMDDGGILASPKYERFDILVARANAWLKLNPTVQATSLETLEYVVEDVAVGKRVDTQRATQTELEKNGSIHVKILRMWLVPKDYGDSLEPQQLGYINVVPACLNPGGVSKSPTFDSLSATLCKLNIMLNQKPLPGDILSAESVSQKFRQYGKWIDPDRCHYREHSDMASSRLIITRLYYQAGSASPAQIAFQDFTPKCQRVVRDQYETTDIESFGQLLHRANQWLQQQSNINLLNMQSTNYKVKKKQGSDIVEGNSDKTLFTSFRTPSVLQTLRVWYTKHTPQSSNSSLRRTNSLSRKPALPHGLMCQTFAPSQVDAGGVFGAPEYEMLSDVRSRLTEWVNHNTELQIMCAESSLVKPPELTGVPAIDTDQVMPTYFHSSTEGSTWLRVLRVYVFVALGSCPLEPQDAQDPPQTLSYRKQCCVLM